MTHVSYLGTLCPMHITSESANLYTPDLLGRTGTTRHGERVVIHGPANDPARCTVYPADAAVRGMESFTPRIAHITLDPHTTEITSDHIHEIATVRDCGCWHTTTPAGVLLGVYVCDECHADSLACEVVACAPRCFCPGDCGCRYPWRTNYCGCKQH